MTFTQKTLRAVTIVGPGRVGRSLQRAALSAGLEVTLLGRGQLESAGPWQQAEGREGSAEPGSQLLLLAVPDTEIARVCEAVCAAGPPAGPVGHLSGATGLACLAAAERAGLPTFSMHPLQSFAGAETALAGVPCAITSEDSETVAIASAFAARLGMSPFTLADGDRALYHAAASIASNFLVTLEQEAVSLLERIGVEDGRQLLTPLVTQTLANWCEQGGSALTGPIARGDEQTVERHLEALRHHAPELIGCYLALAERTRAVAASPAGPQPEEQRQSQLREAIEA